MVGATKAIGIFVAYFLISGLCRFLGEGRLSCSLRCRLASSCPAWGICYVSDYPIELALNLHGHGFVWIDHMYGTFCFSLNGWKVFLTMSTLLQSRLRCARKTFRHRGFSTDSSNSVQPCWRGDRVFPEYVALETKDGGRHLNICMSWLASKTR